MIRPFPLFSACRSAQKKRAPAGHNSGQPKPFAIGSRYLSAFSASSDFRINPGDAVFPIGYAHALQPVTGLLPAPPGPRSQRRDRHGVSPCSVLLNPHVVAGTTRNESHHKRELCIKLRGHLQAFQEAGPAIESFGRHQSQSPSPADRAPLQATKGTAIGHREAPHGPRTRP